MPADCPSAPHAALRGDAAGSTRAHGAATRGGAMPDPRRPTHHSAAGPPTSWCWRRSSAPAPPGARDLGGPRVDDPRAPRRVAALGGRAPRPRAAGRAVAAGSLERAPSRRADVGAHQPRSAAPAPGAPRRRACRLPESPQHRAWRNARTAAAQELERFRASLHERLRHAELLLDADDRHTRTHGSSSPRSCSARAGAWPRRATACTSGASPTTGARTSTGPSRATRSSRGGARAPAGATRGTPQPAAVGRCIRI